MTPEQLQARRIEMLAIAAMAVCAKDADTCACGLMALAAMRQHPDFTAEFNNSENWKPEDFADCMALTVGEAYADSIICDSFTQPTAENARPIDLVVNALTQALYTPVDSMLEGFPNMEIINVEMGDTVLCDSCSKDYTASTATGGLLFQSKAICPECLPKWDKAIAEEQEEHFIRARCPEDKAFASWVRDDVRTGKCYQ